MIRPLDGLKVLDLTWVVAGPVMTRALADFGATVVRVESSTRVETARYMQPFINGEFSTESSALYGTWNAGKLGVTVNLQTEEGRQVVRDLAAWSDVVLEAFSPGTMEKWGLDYATLSAQHPGLIMISSAINGQTGPNSRLAGYGNVGAALSGFQEISGWPEDVPIGPYGPYTDFVGPRMGLAVLLAAIDHHFDSGEGAYIDLSQVESGVYFQAPEVLEYEATGRSAERRGNRDRVYVPHGVFRAQNELIRERDVERFIAIAITDDDQWPRLAEWIGEPRFIGDEDLKTAAGRRRREDEIEIAIEKVTLGRTAKAIETDLQAMSIPAHVVASPYDIAHDEQLADRNHLVRLQHTLFESIVVEAPRYLLSDTPGEVTRAAPTFGQDNRFVLEEILGYDNAHIENLIETGVMK